MSSWRWAPTCRAILARFGVLILFAALFLTLPDALETRREARAAATVCTTPVAITNGDFEAPVIPANTMVLEPEADMGGWKTTAPDKLFEHWREVRQGFTSGQGNQFIELNANFVSAVYQDLVTTPGQTLRWELKHRGRLGTDVMAVKIGAPGAVTQQGALLSDGAEAWGTHSLNYTVPSGQSLTRFWFESVSAAQNKPTHGNFLDAISFGSDPCLATSTTVSGGGAANVGDVLTYTVGTVNQGGNPAKAVVLTDDLPAGVTFVPGSIRTVNGSSSASVSDGVDSDTGEYDAATRTVRVRAGLGAGASTGGTLPVGGARSFSYQVRVTPAAASSVVVNESTATFYNDLTASTRTSTSSSAGTTVAAATDLGITAVVSAPGVIAGRTATTVLTVASTGPDDAATVQVSAVVPFGITAVNAATPLGSCSSSTTPPAGPSTVTCAIPTLARNTSTTVTITGTVLPQATPGAQATLTASVGSATYEVNQADNATSVSAAVATSTDLTVVQTYTPAVPVAGSRVTYTVTVANQGPSLARGIMLTDPIAGTSDFVSATSATGTCTITALTRTVECSLNDMMPGTTATVTVVVDLPSGGAGLVNNAVSVSSGTPEVDVRDNNHSVSKAGTAEADVGVRLTIGATRAKPGDTVPFTLTVTNNGPSDATSVSFNTIVPLGFTVNRPPSAICTATACTVPKMVPGQVITINGTTTVGPGAAAGLQSASTTVISPTTDPLAANDTSTVSFTIDLEAGLAVTQTLTNPTAGETGLVAGHPVRGAVTVTNGGPTRAEGLVLRQAVPAGRTIPMATTSNANCAFQGTGTPGNTTPDGGIYVCTRASLDPAGVWQIDFGAVTLAPGYPDTVFARTATISATSPDPDPADNTVVTSRAVEHRSDLEITRVSLTPAAVVQTNDVRFEITVANKGPSDAVNVGVREEPQTGLVIVSGSTTDGSFTALTWTVPVIAVGGTARLTVSGIAQGAGTLTGVSRIVASDSVDPVSADNTASGSIVSAPAAPALTLEVTPTAVPGTGGFAENDVITYSYQITNTGNLDATGLTVAGTRGIVGATACNGGTLTVGQAVTCSGGGYSVTATDVSGGVPIRNMVTATAQTAATVASAEFARVTTDSPLVVPRASLVVVVTPAVSDPAHQYGAAAGDLIGYDYTVTNNGNISMTGVTLTDTATGPITCGPTTLAIGATLTCTTPAASRITVTQADLDTGGTVTNDARVTGRPGGGAVESFGPFRAAVAVAAPAPTMTMTVAATASRSPAGTGDTIAYEYRIENTGNVTLTTVEVSDSRLTGVTCPATIAVGVTGLCSSPAAQPYVVTQADTDTGALLRNDVIVSAVGVTPGSVIVTAEGGTSVPVRAPAPALTLSHTVTVPPGGVVADDVVTLTYRVVNSGNVTMRAVGVSDTLSGAATCPAAPIPVGGDLVCTGTAYRVVQADVDRTGPITGTATVRGQSPSEVAAADYGTDPISVAVAPGATELSVVASAVVEPPEHRNAVEPGDRIDFSYLITNTGAVTMQAITATDTLAGVVSCPGASLAPGLRMVCAPVSRQVTAADIRAGGAVTTTVSVTARGPGRPLKTFGPAEASVAVLVPVPSLQVTTTSEVSSGTDTAGPGDRITFRYEVVNAGNQPMTGVAVTTERAGPVTCPATLLAVRAGMTCASQPYVVTQGDVDAGVDITDRISVAGKAPADDSARTFGPFPVRVKVVPAAPALRLAMTANVSEVPNGSEGSASALTVSAGSAITYRYAVTNTGNVTVSDIVVDDTRAGPITCADTGLVAGGTIMCEADAAYQVTQDDVDAAAPIVAEAVARAVHGADDDPVVSNTAEATILIAAAAPALTADQKATWTDTDGDGRLSTRDDVISTLAVTNTGNVTLVDIRVTGLPAAVTCTPDRAAPRAAVRCVSAVYHLTTAEIRRGQRTYQAYVVGDLLRAGAPPAEATAPSTVVIPADDDPDPTPTVSPSPSPSSSPSASPGPGDDEVPVTGDPALPIAMSGAALISIGCGLLLLSYQVVRARGRHRLPQFQWKRYRLPARS